MFSTLRADLYSCQIHLNVFASSHREQGYGLVELAEDPWGALSKISATWWMNLGSVSDIAKVGSWPKSELMLTLDRAVQEWIGLRGAFICAIFKTCPTRWQDNELLEGSAWGGGESNWETRFIILSSNILNKPIPVLYMFLRFSLLKWNVAHSSSFSSFSVY